LTRATSEAVAAQESEVAAKRQRHLERAKGFASVMECLTNCNKPIVGHNMLLDLAYLYQQFIGNLPPSLDEFREQVNQVLGQVFFKK
jgi:poly(A)-specific ribonuclease